VYDAQSVRGVQLATDRVTGGREAVAVARRGVDAGRTALGVAVRVDVDVGLAVAVKVGAGVGVAADVGD
jgi:hypothetical protein